MTAISKIPADQIWTQKCVLVIYYEQFDLLQIGFASVLLNWKDSAHQLVCNNGQHRNCIIAWDI
jgi:hypothetical protein